MCRAEVTTVARTIVPLEGGRFRGDAGFFRLDADPAPTQPCQFAYVTSLCPQTRGSDFWNAHHARNAVQKLGSLRVAAIVDRRCPVG